MAEIQKFVQPPGSQKWGKKSPPPNPGGGRKKRALPNGAYVSVPRCKPPPVKKVWEVKKKGKKKRGNKCGKAPKNIVSKGKGLSIPKLGKRKGYKKCSLGNGKMGFFPGSLKRGKFRKNERRKESWLNSLNV